MLKIQTMRKALLLFTMILFTTNIYSQDLKTNNDGFTTIGYFSSKDVIDLKFKILKISDYYFLQVIIDDSIYPDEYYLYGVTIDVNLTDNGKQFGEHISLEPIDNEFKGKRIHLIYLNNETIKALKENEINSVELQFGVLQKYNFKNIKEPNFFKNNLK